MLARVARNGWYSHRYLYVGNGTRRVAAWRRLLRSRAGSPAKVGHTEAETRNETNLCIGQAALGAESMTTTRRCPRCQCRTAGTWCCGLDLTARKRWTMTRERITHVHALALARKGLDSKTYRLRLRAVGVESSLHLARDQFERLVQGLLALPDSEKWLAKEAAKRQRRVA